MITALANKPEHVKHLCERLGIGLPTDKPSPVTGGFHHRVWRLQTDQGVYAVKQLSADTDLANPQVIAHYNLSETVATEFRGVGIQAISALPWQGQYLQLLERDGYLVYPWSEARALGFSQCSQQHALAVAGMLATMHRADIDVPGLQRQGATIPSLAHIEATVRRAAELHVRYAAQLELALPGFLQIARQAMAAAPVMEQHRVISHGDLDQKNVLWDDAGQPLVIDWESAVPLNPTYDLIQTALEWSGIARQFDQALFAAFLAAYQQGGGRIESKFVEPALHCVLGDWLSWLLYVVDRSAYSANALKRKRGSEQFDLVFPTLLRLQALVPALQAHPLLQSPVSLP